MDDPQERTEATHEYGPPTPPPPAPPRRRRPGWMLALVAALVVALAIGGFFTYRFVSERNRERREAEAATAAHQEAMREYEQCQDELEPTLVALAEIDARLDVGLIQAEYGELVGDAAVAHSRLDAGSISNDCESILVDLEEALDLYAGVSSDWNDCITDFDCDTDLESIAWQTDWASASERIQGAESALDSLDPGEAPETSDR